MSNKLVIIQKPNGDQVESHYYNYSNDVTMEFYFLKNEEDTKQKYPIYNSGKSKGDIAFKKDGALVLSEAFYNKLRLQNGYLQDSRKVVELVMPDESLKIVYYKKVFYMGIFVEKLLKEMDLKYSRYIHSLAAVKEAYFQGVLKWEKIQTRTKLTIEVESSPCYKYVTLEGERLDSCYEMDRLLEHYRIPDGTSELNFKCPIHKIFETPFSYTLKGLETEF